jgi:hypothetical protein
MSVWNDILQATHSALIDELGARFPDEKLELGLPKRFDGFGTVGDSKQILFWETRSAAEGSGFTALAGVPDQPAKELSEIFAATRTRAEKEFKIRNIAASYGSEFGTTPKARMTIWLPIAIRRPKETRTYDLALGLGI